ncbi:MAG: ABC transporter ATP-binding protein [Chloroflexi bacterium]|nr:ABC transporter ATP-binding protein [Chloroflexota bacterium]
MNTNGTKIIAKDLVLNFGGVTALNNVSFELREGEILAIIGPNGAGKTCVLNCINGFYRPQNGKIIFEGYDLTKMKPHKVAKLGLARTFQNIELYTGLSTLDNLMAARHNLIKYNFLTAGLYFGWAHRQEMEHRRIVEDIIDFLEMAPIRYKPVGSLPYGQRKRVELGRALALEPKVLLLDEPMAGMNVEEKEDMARFILDTFELKNIPIIIIEHDMGLVMDIADRIIVLDFGQKIAEGTPEEIKTNPEVIRAYLGTE